MWQGNSIVNKAISPKIIIFNLKEDIIMAFCGKCGTKLSEEVKFCPGCGASTYLEDTQPMEENIQSSRVNMATNTAAYEASDIEQNKLMAILAYIGILVLIPLFAAKESKFARYHTNQGLILAICGIVYSVAYTIVTQMLLAISWRLGLFISPILGLIGLVFFVLAVMGIINASQGKEKELPIIGKFTILK